MAAAMLLPAAHAAAEPLGHHGYLIPFAGYTMFDSDTVGAGIAPGLRDRAFVGARAGYRFSRLASFELGGGYAPSNETVAPRREVDFIHLAANVLVTPLTTRYARPFLLLGGGASRLKPNGGNRVNMGNAEIGGGIDFWFSDGFGLRLEARDVMWCQKDAVTDVRTHTLILGAGLAFPWGATPRDTDGDGVPDRRDQCPDTPRGARVDEKGCPLDGDGDKVFDGLDPCPDTPRGCTVDARGCPSDADGDGVCDGVDTCPDTPKGATVSATGCPSDADGDRVFDGLDQCASTPRGCTVDARGCPSDSDGDGVCDGLDRCPDTTPGLKVDSDGCPIELVERETELLDTGMIRLQNINFETNKADLLPESLPTLDIVGQVLGKWPELRIEVGGHTDARGSDQHNQRLSEARANSVLTYLTTKFPSLKPEQFTVKGYGESKPLVPNTGALNWAKNRRVEFVVLNKDVLRREVERRRLLKRDEGGAPRDTSSSAPPDTTKR
jgi:outer membrane protein OmpA-like peptidoglycan-associated protein